MMLGAAAVALGVAGTASWWARTKVWSPPPRLNEETLRRATSAGAKSAGARYAKLGDRFVSWWEFGDPEGAPLVALHGLGASGLYFEPQDAYFRARRIRCIAPTLVGGLSDVPRTARILDLSTTAFQLVDHLGVDRFTVIASSFGTIPALGLLATTPERIERAALFGPLLPFDWGSDAPETRHGIKREDAMLHETARRRPRMLYPLTAMFGAYPTAAKIRSFIDERLPSEERRQLQPGTPFHAFFARMLEEAGQRGYWFMAKGTELAFGREPGFTLAQVADAGVELYLETGTEDNAHTPAMAQYLHRQLRGSKLHLVPGMGRFGATGPMLNGGLDRFFAATSPT